MKRINLNHIMKINEITEDYRTKDEKGDFKAKKRKAKNRRKIG